MYKEKMKELEKNLTYMERQELKKDLILIYLRADTKNIAIYFLYLSFLFLIYRNVFLGLFFGLALVLVILLESILVMVWRKELLTKYYNRLGMNEKQAAKIGS